MGQDSALRWFARTEQLLGTAAFDKLKSARVAVFGMGGVGSFAVEALARAGVGMLRLVDFDTVHASNINRQLYALHSSIGKPKVSCAMERVLDINPLCKVDPHVLFVDSVSVQGVLDKDLTLVVDAIDSVSSKVILLTAAWTLKIPIISSMGAGGRSDGSFIRVGDISESNSCPLARIIRKRLHRNGIYTGIRCVYSTEPARNKLPFLAEDADPKPDRGRQRTPLGTISYMPGLFGLTIAQEVITAILGRHSLHGSSIC